LELQIADRWETVSDIEYQKEEADELINEIQLCSYKEGQKNRVKSDFPALYTRRDALDYFRLYLLTNGGSANS